MPETISLIPPNMNVEQFEHFNEQRNHFDYRSFQKLEELLKHIPLMEKAIKEYDLHHDGELSDLLTEAQYIVDSRIAANENVMRAMVNQDPVPMPLDPEE